ncbi:methyltransferase [Chromatiales bacterium (ex Bugula neritina AB1)]|nr:methyltransferase [Chromatiales bacterium (ex Bugula neritina AB1)]
MSAAITRGTLAKLREDLVITEELCGQKFTFHTTWGLFSPREVDAGTKLLLNHIKVGSESRVLDLGCGYGALGLTLAKVLPSAEVCLVDKDFVAVAYCRKNAEINKLTNVHVQLSNGLNDIGGPTFDLVATNLPAKSGKELYYLMFYDIHARLNPGGRFYIVTITGLRGFVKRAFTEIFGNYQKLKQGNVYTVAVAEKR